MNTTTLPATFAPLTEVKIGDTITFALSDRTENAMKVTFVWNQGEVVEIHGKKHAGSIEVYTFNDSARYIDAVWGESQSRDSRATGKGWNSRQRDIVAFNITAA